MSVLPLPCATLEHPEWFTNEYPPTMLFYVEFNMTYVWNYALYIIVVRKK